MTLSLHGVFSSYCIEFACFNYLRYSISSRLVWVTFASRYSSFVDELSLSQWSVYMQAAGTDSYLTTVNELITLFILEWISEQKLVIFTNLLCALKQAGFLSICVDIVRFPRVQIVPYDIAKALICCYVIQVSRVWILNLCIIIKNFSLCSAFFSLNQTQT